MLGKKKKKSDAIDAGGRSSPCPKGSKHTVSKGPKAQAGATPCGCGKELVVMRAPVGLPALPRNSSTALDLGCCCKHTTLLRVQPFSPLHSAQTLHC